MYPARGAVAGAHLDPVGPASQQIDAGAAIHDVEHGEAAARAAAQLEVGILHDDRAGTARGGRGHRVQRPEQQDGSQQASDHVVSRAVRRKGR